MTKKRKNGRHFFQHVHKEHFLINKQKNTRNQRLTLDWTWIGLDPDYSKFCWVWIGLLLSSTFKIRNGFGLSQWKTNGAF